MIDKYGTCPEVNRPRFNITVEHRVKIHSVFKINQIII